MHKVLMAIGGPWHGEKVRILASTMYCLDVNSALGLPTMNSDPCDFAPMPLVEYNVRMTDRYHAYLVVNGLSDDQIDELVAKVDPMGTLGEI